MKSLACAIGLLALAVTATSPARADYAVVQFGDGYCRNLVGQRGHPLGHRLDQDRGRLA